MRGREWMAIGEHPGQRAAIAVLQVGDSQPHLLRPAFEQAFYVALAVQDGDDLYQFGGTVHDQVLIHAEEQHVPVGKIGALMAFAGNIGQTLEGVHQLGLNPVSNRQTSFSEQVAPDLPEIVFGFRRYDVRFH